MGGKAVLCAGGSYGTNIDEVTWWRAHVCAKATPVLRCAVGNVSVSSAAVVREAFRERRPPGSKFQKKKIKSLKDCYVVFKLLIH